MLCSFIVASICFGVGIVPDKDTLDRAIINLRVMAAENKNEGMAADFLKAAVIRAAVVISLVGGDSVLEGCCRCSLIEVRGCEVEFIPQIVRTVGVNAHCVSFSHKSMVVALDASAVG